MLLTIRLSPLVYFDLDRPAIRLKGLNSLLTGTQGRNHDGKHPRNLPLTLEGRCSRGRTSMSTDSTWTRSNCACATGRKPVFSLLFSPSSSFFHVFFPLFALDVADNSRTNPLAGKRTPKGLAINSDGGGKPRVEELRPNCAILAASTNPRSLLVTNSRAGGRGRRRSCRQPC